MTEQGSIKFMELFRTKYWTLRFFHESCVVCPENFRKFDRTMFCNRLYPWLLNSSIKCIELFFSEYLALSTLRSTFSSRYSRFALDFPYTFGEKNEFFIFNSIYHVKLCILSKNGQNKICRSFWNEQFCFITLFFFWRRVCPDNWIFDF